MKPGRGKIPAVLLVLLAALIVQASPVTAIGGVVISSVNFPDASFREYVKGFDENNDNFLDTAELDAVTKILCHARNIASLKGIEHFTR